MNLPNLKDAKVRTKNQVNIKYGEYWPWKILLYINLWMPNECP